MFLICEKEEWKLWSGDKFFFTVDGKNVSDTNISKIDSRKPYILPSTGGPGSTRTFLAYALFAGICGLMTVSAFRTNKKKQRD